MKKSHFEFLSLEDKMDYLQNYCVRIAMINTRNFCYELYHCDTFYVELKAHIHDETSNWFLCFDDLDYLEPYLSRIDISEVLQREIS